MDNAIFDDGRKVNIFKTLAIPKIIHISVVTNVLMEIINKLNEIQK